MPMANALGYERFKRSEDSIDVNRDFAFDTSPSRCMASVAARAVNELWREHIFQLAVTFHGGNKQLGSAPRHEPCFSLASSRFAFTSSRFVIDFAFTSALALGCLSCLEFMGAVCAGAGPKDWVGDPEW